MAGSSGSGPPQTGVGGQPALLAQALTYPFQTVLDVGAGAGEAALAFHAAGKSVTATSYDLDSYGSAGFPDEIVIKRDVDVCDMACFADASFDAVWCAHVVEHTLNPGLALAELRRVLKPDGWLFVMVPPFKHAVVGGHVTPGWNLGILMYVLVMAGFEVRTGAFVRHGHNLAAFVRRGELSKVRLRYDIGDIEALKDSFPPQVGARQGFDGDLDAVNWTWAIPNALREQTLKSKIRRRVSKAFNRLVS